MSNAVDETSYRVDGVTYRNDVMSNAEDETLYRVNGVTCRNGVMSNAVDKRSNRVDGVTYCEDIISNVTDKTSYRAGRVLILIMIPLHKKAGGGTVRGEGVGVCPSAALVCGPRSGNQGCSPNKRLSSGHDFFLGSWSR